MELYKYKAKTAEGKTVTGTLSAMDEQELHQKLKADNKFLLSATVEKKHKMSKRMKSDRLSEFSRNLGELVGAGVSLVRTLKIISEDETITPAEKQIYQEILKSVRAGNTLSDALIEQGDTFPPLFINMFKSAESSGNLDKTASQLGVYYNKEFRLNKKIKSSMTYPKFLAGMIVIVVAIIMGYVVPQFEGLFSQMEELPITTTIMLAISNFVTERWYLLLVGGIVIYMTFKLLASTPNFKMKLAKMELNLPKLGRLRRIVYTARFGRTLASLYTAGIPIISCLQIAKGTIGNAYIESQFDQCISNVRAGMNLSEAIDKIDGFTKKLSSTILVGEETGSLDGMLNSVADQLEYESEVAINSMVSIIEPAMIVVMAVVVGFIIISVIQPIYGSYESIASQNQ